MTDGEGGGWGSPDAGGEIIIKLRGCPFRVTETEVVGFLNGGGANVSPGSITIQQGPDGRPSGTVYVKVPTEDDAQKALAMQRQTMGTRYIELYRETAVESVSSAASFGSRGSGLASIGSMPVMAGDIVVKLRGLPFAATELDLANFFTGLNIAQQGIHMVFDNDNRPSGEAFVEFQTPQDLQGALSKDRQMLGHRYVEVFRSSRAEMQGGPPPNAGGGGAGGGGGIPQSAWAGGGGGAWGGGGGGAWGGTPYGGGGGGGGAMRPGDWNCPSCGFMNFASRPSCKQCNAAKPM